MNNNIINKDIKILEGFEAKTSWREEAEYRRNNRRWLRYSGFIALKIIHRLDELDLSKHELAQKMNCSPQYISKLVKGQENLTLETIAKLEDVLGIDLVRNALSHVQGYGKTTETRTHLVADPQANYNHKIDPSSPCRD